MEGQVKRSVVLFSHATSVALEPSFWDVLEEIAREKGLSLPGLIEKVDQNRAVPKNLSASLRVFALETLREKVQQLKKND